VGRVREVRWRSTLIETRNGDLLIIPNALVTKSLITNFSKDGLENRRWVYFNVHLRHPPNQVIDTVKAALVDIPNVSTNIPPDVVLMDFGESWGRYAVRYRLVDFKPDDPTDSAVRVRVWYALKRANLEMPYPAHNLFVTELNAARDQRKGEDEQKRRLDALEKVAFLAPLDEAERSHLARGLRHEIFGPGEIILRAGDPGDSLYLIRTGEVVVKIGNNGLERELAHLKPGDFFGEMSLMTGEPRHATVVAKGDAECYVVERALFQDIFSRKESLVGEIGQLLHQRQMALKGEQAGLSADAAARVHAQNALLGRIKSFFGLGD
jgi:CRP-like cAMP-binding protein